MTPENKGNYFAGKTQNFEAVVQYQFDFGLRPSIGYVQTKGKDLQARGGFSGGDADLVKYVEVGTVLLQQKHERLCGVQVQPTGRQRLYA